MNEYIKSLLDYLDEIGYFDGDLIDKLAWAGYLIFMLALFIF